MTNRVYKGNKLEYKKFRVRGNIKSFRDLEIYKQTTQLSSQIYDLTFPLNIKGKKLMEGELELLRNLSKQVPRLIAEAYGDRFTSKQLAYQKLEQAMRTISQIITKLDFLLTSIVHQETKQILINFVRKYELQRRKTLNLKRAWERWEEKKEKV